jgi:hypothetical protein
MVTPIWVQNVKARLQISNAGLKMRLRKYFKISVRDIPDFPSGWWIVPSVAIGMVVWYYIIVKLSSMLN